MTARRQRPINGIQAAVLFTVLRLLARPEGATIEELSAELGGCLKTARRALEAARNLGFTVWHDDEHHGRRRWHVHSPVATFRKIIRP